MRKIEFRGKRVDSGEWVYGYLLEKWAGKDKPRRFAIDPCISFYEDGWTSWPDEVVEVIPESVSQFTGLYDKNGKEIYEGDIVESRYMNPLNGREVIDRYNVALAKSTLYKMVHSTGQQCREGLLFIRHERVKIVGNIHDNPEILKAT